jgi:hypothetical protein
VSSGRHPKFAESDLLAGMAWHFQWLSRQYQGCRI